MDKERTRRIIKEKYGKIAPQRVEGADTVTVIQIADNSIVSFCIECIQPNY